MVTVTTTITTGIATTTTTTTVIRGGGRVGHTNGPTGGGASGPSPARELLTGGRGARRRLLQAVAPGDELHVGRLGVAVAHVGDRHRVTRVLVLDRAGELGGRGDRVAVDLGDDVVL